MKASIQRSGHIVRAGLVGFMLFAGMAATQLSGGQASPPAQPTRDVAQGRELFAKYCASCHGAGGTGNGPAAAAMRRSPPDLTGLALANGGVFPVERVGRIVDGRDVESDGDREMQV